jgi:hypothetical protein
LCDYHNCMSTTNSPGVGRDRDRDEDRRLRVILATCCLSLFVVWARRTADRTRELLIAEPEGDVTVHDRACAPAT